MTPEQLRAFRAAYAFVWQTTSGNDAPSEVIEWGLDPSREDTWCDPLWVRDLCEEAGILDLLNNPNPTQKD